MRHARSLALALVLSFTLTATADTVKGTAKSGSTKVYAFISDQEGPVLLTAMWKSAGADVFFLVLDDSDDPLVWCIGASTSGERLQRCEFGGWKGYGYLLGVSSFSGASAFDLNVKSAGEEFLRRPGSGLVELRDDDPRTVRVQEALTAVAGRRATEKR